MSFFTPVFRPAWPLKSIPVFRPGLWNYVNITLIRTPPTPPPLPPPQKKKISENPFRIRTFLFLSHSFEIETINTFIHSCSSLDNHTRFQHKTAQKSYPLGGAHTYSYVAYAREYPWGLSLAWENNRRLGNTTRTSGQKMPKCKWLSVVLLQKR